MAKFVEKQKKMIAALIKEGVSVEKIKEKFGATAKQSNSYFEKYKDDESLIGMVTSQKEITEETSSSIVLLTEQEIMDNHLKLRQITSDIFETKAEFIKRKLQVPVITVGIHNSYVFNYEMKDIDLVEWGKTERVDGVYICQPSLADFQIGKLVYQMESTHDLTNATVLSKKGFSGKTTIKTYAITVSSPLKIYGKSLLYKGSSTDVVTKGTTPKILNITKLDGSIIQLPIKSKYNEKRDGDTLRINGEDEFRLIKRGTYSLKSVLKENNLSKKEQRTEAFNQWLLDQGYM